MVLTGSADKPMAARCIASGAEDVVMKGRGTAELLRFAIRFALRCVAERARTHARVHA